jgi:hypothetical protein
MKERLRKSFFYCMEKLLCYFAGQNDYFIVLCDIINKDIKSYCINIFLFYPAFKGAQGS